MSARTPVRVKTLTIDGREVGAREDQTILEVARENDIRIPTLCELTGLSNPGACRLCLVEVKGVPRLQESGGIEKDRLEVGRGKNTEDAVPRRLCLPGDDRDLLPEKAVHQRRFSNVRLANDGDIAAAESVFHCHHFTDAREIRVPTLPILRCGRE